MKLVRNLSITLVILVMIGAVIIGCGGNSDDEDATRTQIVSVTRGNLSTTISAIGTVTMSNQADLTLGSGGSTSTVYTITEVNVAEGDTVNEGDILARLDTTSLQATVTQARASLRTTQINLEEATSEATLLKAQAAVENAEINLTNAKKDLEETEANLIPDAQEALEAAQTNLVNVQTNAEISIKDAENNLTDAKEAQYDYWWNNIYVEYMARDLNVPDDVNQENDKLLWAVEKAEWNLETTKQTAASNIADAEDAVVKAEEALTEARSDSLTIKQKQLAVTQAQVNLLEAQDNLAYIEAGYNIEQLQLQVDNAQADLDEAEAMLASATLTAPFDGVVSSVNVIVGDEVTANTTILHLVDIDTMQVDASVDEIDVAQVETGQMATITLDALSNVILRGTVTAVSPLASSQSGVVSYPLTIALIDAAGKGLRDGMSATIEIISIQAEDVLLIPTQAITRNRMEQVVNVVIDEATGETEERVVQTGETNGTMTEVTGGLSEGEQVKVTASSSTTTTTNNMGFPGGFGGGFPGGGGMRFRD